MREQELTSRSQAPRSWSLLRGLPPAIALIAVAVLSPRPSLQSAAAFAQPHSGVPTRVPNDGSSPSPSDLAVVRAHLVRRLADGLEVDAQKFGLGPKRDLGYRALKAPKAAAVCAVWNPDPGILFWGVSWKTDASDTPRSIRRAAIEHCNAARQEYVDKLPRDGWRSFLVDTTKECDCRLALENDAIAIAPPEKAVLEALAQFRRVSIPTLCPGWLRGNRIDPAAGRCPGQSAGNGEPPLFIVDHLDPPVPDAPPIRVAPPVMRRSEVERLQITNPQTGRLADDIWFFDEYAATTLAERKTPRFRVNRVPAAGKATFEASSPW